MKERIKQEKIPVIDASAKDALIKLDPDLESSLKKLADLPEKLRDDILNDITTHRIAGMKPEALVKRLEVLITGGHDLDWLSDSDSDKVYRPTLRKEEINEEMIKLAREISEDRAKEKKQEPPSTVH